MGIDRLLTYLNSITKEIKLEVIRSSTVAVDAYGWLYRGSIESIKFPALGEDGYLDFSMKLLNMLVNYNVNVILVFDGSNLEAKRDEDAKRKKKREKNKKKAETATTESERKKYLVKSIKVSHEMAVKLIMKARQLGVKYIVAPYEADAQLAYLCRKNIVDYVITDDSDLLPFGAQKVLYQLNLSESASLIKRNDINTVLQLPVDQYSFNKFRHICIIHGCDYFEGINNVGFHTALQMIKDANKNELSDILANIQTNEKIKPISEDTINQAIKADLTFQYQIVFDPINCKQVPLNDYPADLNSSTLEFAGKILEDQKMVLELATGKRDPTSNDFVPNFDLDIQSLIPSEVFYFDRSKTPNYQQKGGTKNLPVKRQYPWKDASKTSESEIDFSNILKTYFYTNILPFEKSGSDNSAHLDNVHSKEESLVLPNSDDKIAVHRFQNDSIIGSSKNESLKRSRTLDISDSAPQLTGKKFLVQSTSKEHKY